MDIKQKWYAQIKILEKFKKKLEKKLEEYRKDVPSQDLDREQQDIGQGIELENIISEIEEEIEDLLTHITMIE